jgi:hypothetical protein
MLAIRFDRTVCVTHLLALAKNGAGLTPEFGACSLSFIEYLLIGVASLLFPNDLLNDKGVNRAAAAVPTASATIAEAIEAR